MAGTAQPSAAAEARAILKRLGVELPQRGTDIDARSPITGETVAALRAISPEAGRAAIACAEDAFHGWREVPPPRRGELVRILGETLREAKPDLGRLVTLEAGKIVSEGLGEVQEMIDICEFAVGLSRQ